MKQLLHEFLLLCGSKGKRVKQSVIFGFFDGIFEAMPFCAVFYLFYHLEQLSWNASFLTLSDAGIVAAIFLVGVIGRWIMKFCIRGAYRMTGGNNFYDGMITCSTLSGKAVCRLVWAMNKAENNAYLEKALSGIPEHFSGKLLEVPVGTGILTMPVYQTMPEADITCLDYSPDMMRQAREKADRLHLKNVTFRQGDVGALPYEDDTFDIVLSLNGFHAFPDKEAAYREVSRVLKPGGTFCGCFYVKGEHKRTDWFVRHIYEKTGFFTPPYETISGLKARLNGMYTDVDMGNLKSMAWFVCRKAG